MVLQRELQNCGRLWHEKIDVDRNWNPGEDVEVENIMVCPGARFAVYLAITTLLNPGDEIIVIEPSWPAYKDCALNAGIKVRTIKTTLETKWEPSIEQINNAINENTKMIVLNYPNNPTGKDSSRKTSR